MESDEKIYYEKLKNETNTENTFYDYYNYNNKHPMISNKLYSGNFENDAYTIIHENKNFTTKKLKNIFINKRIKIEEPEEILIFIVHGIGQNDQKLKTILNDRIKVMINLLYEKEGQTKFKKNVHFRMIDWKTPLNERENNIFDHLVDKNNKTKYPKMFIQEVPLDLMHYMSNRNKYKIINDVVSQINSYYHLVKKYRPNFKGNVSIIGHSLGSVIMYEILNNMTTDDNFKNFGMNKYFNLENTIIFKDENLFGINEENLEKSLNINRKNRKKFLLCPENNQEENKSCSEINLFNIEADFFLEKLDKKRLDLKIKTLKIKEENYPKLNNSGINLTNKITLDLKTNQEDKILINIDQDIENKNYLIIEKTKLLTNDVENIDNNENCLENKLIENKKITNHEMFTTKDDSLNNIETSYNNENNNIQKNSHEENSEKKENKVFIEKESPDINKNKIILKNLYDHKGRMFIRLKKSIFYNLENEWENKKNSENSSKKTITQDSTTDFNRYFRLYSKNELILPLIFSIEHYFTIGSPLSLFLTIEHGKNSHLYDMETIKDFHNIIHPMDPLAYRIEHLIYGFEDKDSSCMLQHFLNNGKRNAFFRNFMNIILCNKEIEDEFYSNDRKRYDYMVQESIPERTVNIIGFLFSHMTYWNNPDVFYFILDIIHK